MPGITRVPCGWPGCPELVPPNSGHCEKHRKLRWQKQNYLRRTDPKREPFDRFYSTGTWWRARNMYIREHPLCVCCNEPGQMVDHIVPRRAGGASLDASNFQTMCRACHAKKTLDDAKKYQLE